MKPFWRLAPRRSSSNAAPVLRSLGERSTVCGARAGDALETDPHVLGVDQGSYEGLETLGDTARHPQNSLQTGLCANS